MKKGLGILNHKNQELSSNQKLLLENSLHVDLILLYQFFDIHTNCFKREILYFQDEEIVLTCFKVISERYPKINFVKGLLDLDSILEEMKYYSNNINEWHVNGFIKLGYCDIDDLLLFQVETGDIFIWDVFELEAISISNSIFQFLFDLKEEIIYNNLDGIHLEQLIKNWGEDFWRVKGT